VPVLALALSCAARLLLAARTYLLSFLRRIGFCATADSALPTACAWRPHYLQTWRGREDGGGRGVASVVGGRRINRGRARRRRKTCPLPAHLRLLCHTYFLLAEISSLLKLTLFLLTCITLRGLVFCVFHLAILFFRHDSAWHSCGQRAATLAAYWHSHCAGTGGWTCAFFSCSDDDDGGTWRCVPLCTGAACRAAGATPAATTSIGRRSGWRSGCPACLSRLLRHNASFGTRRVVDAAPTAPSRNSERRQMASDNCMGDWRTRGNFARTLAFGAATPATAWRHGGRLRLPAWLTNAAVRAAKRRG